jgi:hypothetical protein
MGQTGFEYPVMSFQFLVISPKQGEAGPSLRSDDNRSNFSRVVGHSATQVGAAPGNSRSFCLLRLYLYEAPSSCHFQASWISNRRKSGSAAKNLVPRVRLAILYSNHVERCEKVFGAPMCLVLYLASGHPLRQVRSSDWNCKPKTYQALLRV